MKLWPISPPPPSSRAGVKLWGTILPVERAHCVARCTIARRRCWAELAATLFGTLAPRSFPVWYTIPACDCENWPHPTGHSGRRETDCQEHAVPASPGAAIQDLAFPGLSNVEYRHSKMFDVEALRQQVRVLWMLMPHITDVFEIPWQIHPGNYDASSSYPA